MIFNNRIFFYIFYNIVLYILLSILFDISVNCENKSILKKNLISSEEKIKNEELETEHILPESEGCTDPSDKKIINGEHFLKLKDNNLERDEINLKNDSVSIKTEDYVTIKNGFFHDKKPFIIYFWKINKELIKNDFYKILFDCAEASSGRPFIVNICVKKYFRRYRVKFSSTCLNCFTDFIGCSFISCNKECSQNQCSNQCRSCNEKNCIRQLLKCTKLERLPDPCE